MKLYILRHEERTIDATFFAPLTEKGLHNSKILVSNLDNLGITKIYCSPFIRTMQTIYPFSIKHKKKSVSCFSFLSNGAHNLFEYFRTKFVISYYRT